MQKLQLTALPKHQSFRSPNNINQQIYFPDRMNFSGTWGGGGSRNIGGGAVVPVFPFRVA
jgi:hypothetical protein